jgi:hypothetical protein
LGAPGGLAIVRAREKAEKTLGAKFNVRAFYDAVLELGSVPLPPFFRARVERFIAEHSKDPYPGYGVSTGWGRVGALRRPDAAAQRPYLAT